MPTQLNIFLVKPILSYMADSKNIRVQPEIDLEPIKKFVHEQVIPRNVKYDESGSFDPNMAHALYRLGIMKMLTPKEFGGLELPLSDLIWIARTLAYGSGGVVATFIGNLLGYSAVIMFANRELREQICSRFLKEFGLWSFAMTEKDHGSDLEQISTRAVKTSKGFIINGEKNFITNASYATDISLFANTYTESGEPLGISCFYIPGDTQGLSRGPGENKLSLRESNTGHLYLKNVFVPENYLIGSMGEGIAILTHCLNRSKTLMGAMSVGICDRALEITTEHLCKTKRFGRPLIDKHSIRHVLSRLSVKHESAWLLTCLAASTWQLTRSSVKEPSMAKLHAGEVVSEITGTCLELFGARGLLNKYEISRLYRDAKAMEIVEGPTLVQELIISKFMVPRDHQTNAVSPPPDKNKKAA